MTTDLLEPLSTADRSHKPALGPAPGPVPGLDIPRIDVLGVRVWAQTMEQATARIAGWIARRTPTYVCVSNLHTVVASRRDPTLMHVHNAAGMVTADGMPLVWLAKLAGHRGAERVYGPDLMLALCERSVAEGWRHYLYGSSEAVLARLKANLERRFPGIAIVGSCAPPFRPMTDAEDAAAFSTIVGSGADIVWVGLGAPKQELWMADHAGRPGAPVMIGVGAAFDFLAGTKRQAPRWMQRNGLEWLFRLASEPRRLASRYLTTNSLFAIYFVQHWLARRHKP